MKRCFWLLLCFFSSLSGLKQEYKTLQAYGDTLFNLISDFVTTNSTSVSSDVTTFIGSDMTRTVFADGLTAGYTKIQILFTCYQTALTSKTVPDSVAEGIHDAMQQELIPQKIQTYGLYTNMGATGALIIYAIIQTYRYIRYDKRLLDSLRGGTSPFHQINTTGPFGPLFKTPNSDSE